MTVSNEQTTRSEVFRDQIAEMKIAAPNTNRDRLFARLGMLLAIIGVALAVISYFMSHNTNNSLEQNDSLTVALIGVTCAIVGSTVFLRYSIAQFLRVWLIRLIHENRGPGAPGA